MAVGVLGVCVWCVGMAMGEEVTIPKIQYTESPDGTSPYSGKVIDCAGGIVVAKQPGGRPRLFVQDPNASEGWAAIQVKGWASDAFAGVSVGDWVRFQQVFVEEFRGTTLLQYWDQNPDGSRPFLTTVSHGHSLPRPLVVEVNQIRAPEYRLQDDAWVVADPRAERFESMLLQVRDVAVLGQGLGKAQDNYGLQSFREPNDAGAVCWASDYLNPGRPKADLYLPAIQPGQRFRAVTGVLEQYTNLGDGFDYYQLLTLSTESLTELCPADLDQDGDVDLQDYRLFVEQLLLPASAAKGQLYRAADLNDDGTVDAADLAAFNAAWQKADVNGDGVVNERDLD
ncbi:MAG: dockerin type I domain-containing protein [Planctomycetes bacterium]|nr:dockerin type I domain-containing protein [Planctomycetota bacterium]